MAASPAPARAYHHTGFPLEDLVRRKRRAGTSIAVVIPARDEQATIAHVVHTLRPLRDDAGLVDELVVVDSNSTDHTAALAAEAGARVVHQADVLPDAGPGHGKGEALWKGLAACDGDLVVFVDADIHDIGQRFVTGLLGPLLENPDVALVKAAYDRPRHVGDVLYPDGGGRVTELLARPVLATFWPELSWIVQPLAGEVAARHRVLEQLPFVQGYGVELAMLIDVAERWGPHTIAQVDLDRRIHHHQSLQALGVMATELLHVVMNRLARQGRLHLTGDLARTLRQPMRDEHGRLSLSTRDVTVTERPPLFSHGRVPLEALPPTY